MFCSTATCYRSLIEQPRPDDIRGQVFCYQTGAGVSYDRDLGPGWKHVAAVRDGAIMKLYVDGRLAAGSTSDEAPLDVTTDAPLRIGFGPHSQFQGKIREVRIYNRALDDGQLQALGKEQGS
jgi:hypothetical protein